MSVSSMGIHGMTRTNQKCNRISVHVTQHVELDILRGHEVQEKRSRPFNFALNLCRNRIVYFKSFISDCFRLFPFFCFLPFAKTCALNPADPPPSALIFCQVPLGMQPG